jgi:hypothetical protein
VGKIHANAEVFDPKTEYSFSYLQVSMATNSCSALIDLRAMAWYAPVFLSPA